MNAIHRPLLGAVALTLLTALAPTAQAVPITPAAFTGSEVMESFEGITAGPNVGTTAFTGILEPAISSAYAFGTGISLTTPVPNPGLFSGGAFLHDTAVATVTNNWGANGGVNLPSEVPFGSTYLGAFGGGGVSFEFTVSSDMARIGAYVSGTAGSTVTLEAYDGLGNLLETHTLPTVNIASWGSNFLGLERSEGIRRVRFSGADFGIDGLTFEAPPVAVPEPATWILLFSGLVGLAIAGSRGERTAPPARERVA